MEELGGLVNGGFEGSIEQFVPCEFAIMKSLVVGVG